MRKLIGWLLMLISDHWFVNDGFPIGTEKHPLPCLPPLQIVGESRRRRRRTTAGVKSSCRSCLITCCWAIWVAQTCCLAKHRGWALWIACTELGALLQLGEVMERGHQRWQSSMGRQHNSCIWKKSLLKVNLLVLNFLDKLGYYCAK